jgi:hypothetical protein
MGSEGLRPFTADEEATYRSRLRGDPQSGIERLWATLDAERERTMRTHNHAPDGHHWQDCPSCDAAQPAAEGQLAEALREAIGYTDEESGLEHWHFARGGRTPEERAGVFVDRGQVLAAIDRVLTDALRAKLGPTEEDLAAELDAALDKELSETERLQEFAARRGIPLPEGLHIDSHLVDRRRP